MSFTLLLIFGFLFGIIFGVLVQRSGFCIAVGLGEIFMGKGKRIMRMVLIIIAISSIGFLITGYISPDLGLKPIGQIRGYGFFNIVSGILFGAGIFLNGGCILGTLRQIGEGNLNFVIILISFIPGMALVVYILDPILEDGYFIEKILLNQLFPVSAAWISATLAILSIILLTLIRKVQK
ncbi:MAG: YeeE/YedE thiosulfate transporter family protein [Candidatus Zixiibacteriota bacterium]